MISDSDCDSADSRSSKRLRSSGGKPSEASKAKKISLNTIHDLLVTTKAELSEKIDAAIGDLSLKLATTVQTCNDRFANTNENFNLVNQRMERLESSIDYFERHVKSCDVLIQCIPMIENENIDLLKDYFDKMCVAVGAPVSSSDIASAFRLLPAANYNKKPKTSVPAKSTSKNHVIKWPSIVYRFNNKHCRDTFMVKYFQRKALNLKDIGFDTPSRIYCNDHLTARSQAIFRAAHKLKQDNIIRYAYSYRGTVYVKKTDSKDERAIKIKSISQLSLFQPVNNPIII